jgi:transcription-repair coupling factor (superfamily II helicase)
MSPDSILAATAAATQAPLARPVVQDVAPSPPPLAAMPPLAPPLPPAGQRTTMPPLPGSADALALAQLGDTAARAGRTLAIVCADALATQRLAEEMAWFSPALRIAIFPDWETLPYDHFSPHQDLVS